MIVCFWDVNLQKIFFSFIRLAFFEEEPGVLRGTYLLHCKHFWHKYHGSTKAHPAKALSSVQMKLLSLFVMKEVTNPYLYPWILKA